MVVIDIAKSREKENEIHPGFVDLVEQSSEESSKQKVLAQGRVEH